MSDVPNQWQFRLKSFLSSFVKNTSVKIKADSITLFLIGISTIHLKIHVRIHVKYVQNTCKSSVSFSSEIIKSKLNSVLTIVKGVSSIGKYIYLSFSGVTWID